MFFDLIVLVLLFLFSLFSIIFGLFVMVVIELVVFFFGEGVGGIGVLILVEFFESYEKGLLNF